MGQSMRAEQFSTVTDTVPLIAYFVNQTLPLLGVPKSTPGQVTRARPIVLFSHPPLCVLCLLPLSYLARVHQAVGWFQPWGLGWTYPNSNSPDLDLRKDLE